MILWCSYCQAFLREKPPFDDPSITHGICDECTERFERGEELVDKRGELQELMMRILDAGSRADTGGIPTLIEEAGRRGLSRASLLVGFLQPALYRVGKAWQCGDIPFKDEQRFTTWCEAFLAHLTTPHTDTDAPAVLIFLTPTNRHTLGARFVAELLEARGISTRVILPGTSVDEAAREVERCRPLLVGVSCALAAMLPEADAFITDLRARLEPGWRGAFVLSGFALRADGIAWSGASGASIATTVDDVERLVRGLEAG